MDQDSTFGRRIPSQREATNLIYLELEKGHRVPCNPGWYNPMESMKLNHASYEEDELYACMCFGRNGTLYTEPIVKNCYSTSDNDDQNICRIRERYTNHTSVI